MTRAVFPSARNDAAANVAIIVAGFVTAYTFSAWPDLIVGLVIASMNADAARADATREVWRAAHHYPTPSLEGVFLPAEGPRLAPFDRLQKIA